MKGAYFYLFLSLNLMAQTPPAIKILPNPESLEDFEHQFKGCPENSQCDQVMGMQMQRWNELISKVREESVPDLKKTQFLELFRSKYGIPVEFYTTKKSQTGFKPLYFNSHCKEHNPKSEELKILKGMAFLKELNPDMAKIWRDQTEFEIPTGPLLNPQPVIVYDGGTSQVFALPLEDQPLYIKNKELHVLKEEDGFFYLLKVGAKGAWKIVDMDMTKLSEWEEKRQNVACPVDKNFKRPEVFGAEFCKTIWDDDQKKLLIVRMHQGCIT